MIWWLAVISSFCLTAVLVLLYESKVRDLKITIKQLKYEKAYFKELAERQDPKGFWYEQ